MKIEAKTFKLVSLFLSCQKAQKGQPPDHCGGSPDNWTKGLFFSFSLSFLKGACHFSLPLSLKSVKDSEFSCYVIKEGFA